MRMVEVRILPPQPILRREKAQRIKQLALGRGQSSRYPAFPAAVHGFHIRVSHLLKVFGGQRRTEASTAIKNEFSTGIGDLALDVAFDDASSQMDRSRNVAAGPLIVLANVHEKEFFSCIHAALDFGYIRLFNLL